MSGAALVWCPFPDAESARAAVARLLDERLIACANIIGTIESHFTWQGARGSASEAGVLMKTRKECLTELVNLLGALHPYDTPAIIGWEAEAAHPATLAWLAASCPAPPTGAPPDAARG
ncbi:MAG: divalent-cation tolerance protein CutA [Erythrobacter cryptus]